MDLYTKELDTKYHQQDAEGFCGAASAQMVLHSRPFNRLLISQQTLHRDIQALGEEVDAPFWFAEPGGLEQALNENRQNDADGEVPPDWRFNLREFDDEPSATEHIVLNIQNLCVPVIALVDGFEHWLVVRGFTTDREPTSENDFEIKGLFIHDPYPVVPQDENLPPPHKDKTESDGCGRGGKRGTSRHYVTYDEWRSTGGSEGKGYMTGVPKDLGSRWGGKFLVISAEPNNIASASGTSL